MKPARVLTIAGSDPGGGAGIQGDLKTITVLGGFGMSVITALTVQNTQGVGEIYELPPDFVARQFDALAGDIGIDAVKTGMLPTRAMVRLIAGKISAMGLKKVVIDPVMAAKKGDALMSKDTIPLMMAELFPLAQVVTPNIPEAELLSGVAISTPHDMKKAAMIIGSSGARNVVIKGGHLREGTKAVDILFDGKEFLEFPSPRIKTRDTHGTGCAFASAIATFLAQGSSVPEAVRAAKEYITAAIRHGFRLGEGQGPINHFPPDYGRGGLSAG